MKKKKTENANKAMARKINFWHILGIVGLSIEENRKQQQPKEVEEKKE